MTLEAIEKRIAEYLALGGFWNPESMEHNKVRALLMDCAAALAQVKAEETPEQLAKRFHETYERLAPSFGYETRKDSAVPWENVPEKNRLLMIAVCAEIAIAPRPDTEAGLREALTFREFSRVNRMRCEADRGFHHSLSSWSASDWVTATTGELGEMANIVKKLNRVRDGIPGNDKTPEELKAEFSKELADVFIYLDLLAQSQGVDLEQAVIFKFDKSSEKIGYPFRLALRASSPVKEAAGEGKGEKA